MVYTDAEYQDLLIEVCRTSKRHPLYKDTVKHAKEMSVHIYGDKPDELLGKVRPGEDQEIKNYRLSIWEPFTKSAADKAITILSKIFNPNLYSIIFNSKNKQAQELKEYTTDYYPGYNSLLGYNKDVLFRKMLADPNAVVAVWPLKFPTSDKETIDPVVKIFGSSVIWWRDEDHFLICIKEEKKKDGVYFTFNYIDKQFIRNFVVKLVRGNKIDIVEEVEYLHGFKDDRGIPEMPAWLLMGNPDSLDDGDIIYRSYIYSAVPHWNKAIIHDSDVDGAYIKHLNPQRYRIGEECQHFEEEDGVKFRCNSGTITMGSPGQPGHVMICPKCKGSGKAVSSPYEDYVITKSKLDAETPFPPVGYTNVPVDATKLVQEKVDMHVKKGMWAINMDIEDKVGENQSGVAKVIDRSAQNDKMYELATVQFDIHLNNQYYFINKYKFAVEDKLTSRKTDTNLPQINKPTHFDIASVAELISTYDVGQKSGLDKNYMKTQMKEIISKDLSTNPAEKERSLFLIDIDPLPSYTVSDTLDVEGKVRQIDQVVHLNLSRFLDKALIEDKNFLMSDRKKQVETFEKYAQEVIDSSAIDTNLLNDSSSAIGEPGQVDRG